jgi:hypothetical protein
MIDSPRHYQRCRAGSGTLARRPHGGRALTQIQRTLSYAGFDPATQSLAFRKTPDPTLAVERMSVRSTAHHRPICSTRRLRTRLIIDRLRHTRLHDSGTDGTAATRSKATPTARVTGYGMTASGKR